MQTTTTAARDAEIEIDGFDTVEDSAEPQSVNNWEATASPVQIPMMAGSTLNPASAGAVVDPVSQPESTTFLQSVMALLVRLGDRAKSFGAGILELAASVAVITQVLTGGACYLVASQVELAKAKVQLAYANMATARANATMAKVELKRYKLEQKALKRAAKEQEAFAASASFA